MSILSRIEERIRESHDEKLISKKWDIKHREPLFKEAHSRLFPFVSPYYFEANPSFLTDYKNFLDMERYPLIMSRDGLIVLADFFLKNLEPPFNFRSILLVPKIFEELVPKSWHEVTATYEFERPLLDSATVPKNILVVGTAISYSFWKQKPEEVLADLRKKIPRESQVSFYLPIRERSVFMNIDESPYIASTMKNLFLQFGPETKVHTDNNAILKVELGTQDAYCDLVDAPYLFYDNYFHHLYSSGNTPALDAKPVDKAPALTYSLSPHHKAHIRECRSKGKLFAQLFYEVKLKNINPDIRNYGFHQFIKNCVVEKKVQI